MVWYYWAEASRWGTIIQNIYRLKPLIYSNGDLEEAPEDGGPVAHKIHNKNYPRVTTAHL